MSLHCDTCGRSLDFEPEDFEGQWLDGQSTVTCVNCWSEETKRAACTCGDGQEIHWALQFNRHGKET